MNLNLKSKMRLKLAKMLDLKFESIATDSITLHYDGELEVGTEVFAYDEEGNLIIPEDGVYETETHALTIEQGIVVEMVSKDEEEVEVEMEGEEVDTPADNNLLARVEVLEGQIRQLVEIIAEITGAVEEVSENVEAVEEDFSKTVGRPVNKPIKKPIIKQSKANKTIAERFFGK